MILASLLFAFITAALHIYIFTMESVTWTRPATWKRFGLASQADAETTKPLAYNQGFYNLFLAIGAFIGLAALHSGPADPRSRWWAGPWSSAAAAPCCWPPPCWRSAGGSTSALRFYKVRRRYSPSYSEFWR